MRKKGYSLRGFWRQTKHYDNHGNLRGESYRNFWGGRTHRDANFNVRGYSYRNFWGGYTRYDKDMNKIGYSYRNFWGGLNYFDKDMNLTGSSYRNFWGGSNYYERRDEQVSRMPQQEYPLAGVNYSDARINVDSDKATFVDYGGIGSDYKDRTSKNQRTVQQEYNDINTNQKDTRDLWGLEAVRGKSCEEILVILKKTKFVMDDLYNYLSEDSGFRRELMDDRQLYKDFWLYILAQQLEISSFTSVQKVKVLGLLLDVLKVENPTSAAQHYDLMNTNSDYKKYMTDCFSARTSYEGFFWTNLSHMPDVHAGKGCTIGTTMTVVDRAVPNIVGVDIGCGMYTVNLGNVDIDFERMDEAAHFIPSGKNVWEGKQEKFDLTRLRCYRSLKDTKRLGRSLSLV